MNKCWKNSVYFSRNRYGKKGVTIWESVTTWGVTIMSGDSNHYIYIIIIHYYNNYYITFFLRMNNFEYGRNSWTILSPSFTNSSSEYINNFLSFKFSDFQKTRSFHTWHSFKQ